MSRTKSLAMVLVIVLATSVSGRQTQAASPKDSIPTFSCVSFPANASERSLTTRFGANNVISGPVYGMDDGPQNGTILFPNDSAARVEILWRDEGSKSGPSMIRVRSGASRWRTDNGIVVGAELRELERRNGRPFRLAGFHTEISGRVQSWAGGLLELPGTSGCDLMVYLQPRPEDTNPRGPFGQVTRGTDLSSGHPAMQTLNPRVVALVLRYSRP